MLNRYCLTVEGPNKTRFRQTSKVEFSQRPIWADKIEKSTFEGEDKMAAIALPLIVKDLRHMNLGTLRQRRGKTLSLADSGLSTDTATDVLAKRRVSRGTLPRRKPVDEWSPLLVGAIILTILTTVLNAYWSYRVNRGVLETLQAFGHKNRDEEMMRMQAELAELRGRLNA